MEDLLIKNIEAGMRGIRLKTKSIKDANVGVYLNRLKTVNIGLYEDYMKQYKQLLEDQKKN